MSQTDPIHVRHNEPEHRFETVVEGQLAMAEYELEDARMIFTHTFSPPALRGRGIAEKLVRAGLEHAREKNYKVVPACSYVAVFIERHKEYQPLLAG